MIKELRLQNFQSHADTTLQFHPGVNAIIGQSDSGKSAILRGLRLVCYNEPNGDSYRSWWGGDTRVTVTLDDGKVERGRTNSKNYYKINEEEPLVAFGQDVPEEVRRLINMEDVNLQQQMDGSFLLSKEWSAGAVAQHFNKVAKLDKIDSSLLKVQQEINSINADIKYQKSELQRIEEQIQTYTYLKEMEADINQLEDCMFRRHDMEEYVQALTSRIREVERLHGKIEKYKKLKDGKELNDLLEKRKERRLQQESIKSLTALIYRIEKNMEKVQSLKKVAKEAPELQNLLDMRKSRENLNVQALSIGKIVKRIQETQKSVKTALKSISELEQDYEKNFPDICPLCNHKRDAKN